MNFINKVRAVLKVATDLLLIGRNKGWWSRKDSAGELFRDGLK